MQEDAKFSLPDEELVLLEQFYSALQFPDAVVLRRLATRIGALLIERTRGLRERESELARYKKMYERSSSLAKIGVWECDLATEALTWTDSVYDIFELPLRTPVTRELILSLYTDHSRAELDALRERAVREASGFTLDIEVRTAKGKPRWVRISADVECEQGRAVRLFGTKQDITYEKQLWEKMRLLAECDPLTGCANRGVFEKRLAAALIAKTCEERLAALVLLDVDGFKQVNDTLGHAAGDECLRQTARQLRDVFGPGSLVARIGGDEFGVLILGQHEAQRVEAQVADAVVRIRTPVKWSENVVSVSASIGFALTADSDAGPTKLFADADDALYAAKAAGRDTYRRYISGKRLRRPRTGRRAALA